MSQTEEQPWMLRLREAMRTIPHPQNSGPRDFDAEERIIEAATAVATHELTRMDDLCAELRRHLDTQARMREALDLENVRIRREIRASRLDRNRLHETLDYILHRSEQDDLGPVEMLAHLRDKARRALELK
ncbi:hypothetical protein KIH74_22595 [Kineosporia sp. J2-2]|uniref:Uncharacterized protein n=1 Tax=Kineosporia corallincola TaxID=2835133 RepID=A0ABS5TKW9_9ACTN|nr:hypothetical protein [Kineosporia corallincola]MBT0771747.1 hypothetical protein [Kineosporia corallincola]